MAEGEVVKVQDVRSLGCADFNVVSGKFSSLRSKGEVMKWHEADAERPSLATSTPTVNRLTSTLPTGANVHTYVALSAPIDLIWLPLSTCETYLLPGDLQKMGVIGSMPANILTCLESR